MPSSTALVYFEPLASPGLPIQIVQGHRILANLIRQKFQCDIRAMLLAILRQPDFPHAASADPLDEGKTPLANGGAWLQSAAASRSALFFR